MRLIHVPVYLIEYVMYHELCHFVYDNHQKDFHDLLKNTIKYVKNLELNIKYLIPEEAKKQELAQTTQ